MSLQFVVGRTGSGKSEYVLREIRESLVENPSGEAIIYLVPNQMTFQAEHDLLHASELGGIVRAQVFSFTRLAWKVLQETGGISRYHVNDVGVNMLLRKIVEKRKSDLKVFRKAADQAGFYEQLGLMISELKNYQVTPESLVQLKETIETTTKSTIISNKLHDIQMIYEEFEQALVHKYVDSQDYLRLLIEKIPAATYLQNAHIYIDGFYEFTPQQIAVIEQLMHRCKKVTIALTGDKRQSDTPFDDLQLFAKTARMYDRIRRLASDGGINIEEDVFLSNEQGRFQHNEALAHLESYYDVRPTNRYGPQSSVQFISAVNRRAEVEGVAREIRTLVQKEGYRYRDIAVLNRNGQDYYDLLKTVFEDYDIPLFIDEKRPMHHHPLVELIQSTLEVIQENWPTSAVFRCVKTDLLFDLKENSLRLREEMDFLENYCLAYGIKGKRWTDKKPWTYKKYRTLETMNVTKTDDELEQEERINRLRDRIVTPIYTLEKRLKRATTITQMCEAMYRYLEECRIPEKLEGMRQVAEENNRLLEAKDHEMVWNAVVDLLDQFVEMLGDEEMSVKEFKGIIETGLQTLQFANVPPSIDQVTISNADHSRLSHVQCAFVIGVNEGIIPKIPEDAGMISEKERELLMQFGVELAPTGKQQLLDEQFAIYLMLTCASRKLYLTYPLADAEGKSLLPSSLIKRMMEMFPPSANEEKFITNDVNDVVLERQLDFVSSPTSTLSFLAQKLQNWKKYHFEDPVGFWWDVYNFYTEHEEWQHVSRNVLRSLTYKNEAKRLPKETSMELYGKEIRGSVSRMESFKRCSFQQFANHGLKLRKRELHKLEAPDIGQLFHSALKSLTENLLKEKKTWSDVSKQELGQMSVDVVDYLAPAIQREILLSSNRFYYIKRKLQQVVHRASLVLRDHSMKSGFAPVGMEVSFGKNEALPSLSFDLQNGATMDLVGQIDRVDRALCSQGTLLRIVDYKSSDRALNLDEVYYGLALQMLTYLDIVITHATEWIGEEALPAGMLYFHVHNPFLNTNKTMDIDEIEEELLKKFKMKGLLLADEESVRLMDSTLESGWSNIVSAAINKTGGFNSMSSVASQEEFNVLKDYVRRTFQEIGRSITDGEIAITPYKLGEQTPCTMCNFKSVCQFDQSLEENDYKQLKPMGRKTALEKIREEILKK
jgi:ATP-dependent helicase/nuclease subunit B